MKTNRVIVLLVVSGTVSAQVQSVWTKRFAGPTNSTDESKFISVDHNGFVYVAGNIPRRVGYPDYAVIKYDQNGDTVWVRYHDSPVNGGGNLHGLVVDQSGNVIVTGVSDGTNYGDFATVKYNGQGVQLWEKRYDGGDVDNAAALAVDESGNIFVTGTTWRMYETDDYLTIKYAPNGDTVWTRLFAGWDYSSDHSTALALDRLGNVCVSGTRDYYYGTVDYVTIKYSSLGTVIWEQGYNGPANDHDYTRAIAVDGSGNVYVTGESNNPNHSPDIATVKYDALGDSLWVQRYNGPGNGDDNVRAMVVDSSGNVIIVGTSYVPGTGLDFLTLKYTTSGVLQWARTYAGYSNYTDYATSVAVDRLGNVYVTGSISSSGTNTDYATIKYDRDGNQKWVATYNGTGNSADVANAVCVDTAGFVYVTGMSQGVGTGADFVTIKYMQTSVDVEKSPPSVPGIFGLCQNSPNPFNSSTTIRYVLLHAAFVSLTVYNMLGQHVAHLVDEVQQPGAHTVQWDASNLASGVYPYKLQTGEFVDVKRSILLK